MPPKGTNFLPHKEIEELVIYSNCALSVPDYFHIYHVEKWLRKVWLEFFKGDVIKKSEITQTNKHEMRDDPKKEK